MLVVPEFVELVTLVELLELMELVTLAELLTSVGLAALEDAMFSAEAYAHEASASRVTMYLMISSPSLPDTTALTATSYCGSVCRFHDATRAATRSSAQMIDYCLT